MILLLLLPFALVPLALPLTPDLPGIDVRTVPGPWQNRTVLLPLRVGTQPLAVHYLEAGPIGGPTVVLLHGFPDTSFGWRKVIPLLAKTNRVLAPDLRGFAGTDSPEEGYDLGTLTRDLTEFILRTAAPGGARRPVHLIAHDWGASIGWRAATEFPELFSSLTVLDIPHPKAFVEFSATSSRQREYRWFVAQLVSPLAKRILAGFSLERRSRKFYLDELQDPSALTPEDARYYHTVFNTPEELRGPLQYYHELAFHGEAITEYFERSGPVRVPTLVLWGARDSYMLKEMAALSCRYVTAECRHHVFPGPGHYLHWEEPAGVVTEWKRFTGK